MSKKKYAFVGTGGRAEFFMVRSPRIIVKPLKL